MNKVKLITNVLGRRDNTINTILGEFSFDKELISNEVDKDVAEALILQSEGTIEIFNEKGGNFKSTTVSNEKTPSTPTEEELAKQKIQEDIKLSKELAKKSLEDLQKMAKDAELVEEDYIKLEKSALIKFLISK